MSTGAGKGGRRPRRRGRKRRSIRLGRHDETALEVMYRWGGVTRVQLQELLPVSRSSTFSVLGRLQESGLVERTSDLAQWQDRAHEGGSPPDFYYLSKRNGNQAIEYGGWLAGVERKAHALESYKHFKLPGKAAHGSLKNYCLLRVLSGAEAAGAVVPFEGAWGESYPDHPYKGAPVEGGRDPGRKNARKQYKDLVPDASFEVRFAGDAGPVTCFLEVETKPRGPALLRKANSYAAWMHREGVLRPVIFVARKDRQAESMRDLLRERIRREAGAGNSEKSRCYEEWVRGLRRRDVQPGELIVFTSVEAVEEEGAYAAIYQPLAGGTQSITLRELCRRTLDAREKLGIREEAA